MIRCVAFDIGNTLHAVRKEDKLRERLASISFLKEHGFVVDLDLFNAAVTKGWTERNNEKGKRVLFDFHYRILKHLGLPQSKKLAEGLANVFLSERLKSNLNSSAAPGVKELFSFLKEKNIYVGAISNADVSWGKGWLKLENLFIADQLILLSNEVGFEKPMREIFDEFYARIKKINPSIQQNEILMVGDKDRDLAAMQAGFQTCLYNPLKKLLTEFERKPDYVISHFLELKKIIES